MKRILLALLCCVAGASLAFGQQVQHLKGYTTALPPTHMAPKDSAAAKLGAVISVTPLIPNKSFDYTVVASPGLGGGVFTGTILGRSPLLRGKTTTTIPTQIIPLVITINDGTRTITYDPTAPDTCISGSPTDISVITASPIFQNTPWTMNGVAMGTTQYVDAFQRAQFGQQGTGYHLILNQSVLGGQALSFSPGNGANFNVTGGCGTVGVVNFAAMDAIVQGLITGPLASLVNAGTLPLFFTKDVVESQSGISLSGCCVLGYHSGLFVGPNLQIYGLFSIDSTGAFPAGYTGTISHEIAEAVNDPTVNNLTPVWGNVGQNFPNVCQNNLEVGDPLSEGFGTPSAPFSVVGGNGLTYSLQELAYYSWFFGTFGLGTGAGGSGDLSNNGTFHHTAVLCPPGTPTGGPF